MSERTTFFKVIYNHLFGIIRLAAERRDIRVHADALLNYLHDYQDEKIQKFKKEELGDEYKEIIHKIRTIMMLLYRIEVLPRSTATKKSRVYSEYDPEGDVVSISRDGINNELVFKDLMMKYYFYLSKITFKADDKEALEFVLDIGYAFLTPYVTKDDKEEWKNSYNTKSEDDYDYLMEKISIFSHVLNRENLQFTKRYVDEMTADFSEQVMMDEDELHS